MSDRPGGDTGSSSHRSGTAHLATGLVRRGARRVGHLAVYTVVPLSICATVLELGAPWEVGALMVLAAPYWYGPVIVYLTQRMPTVAPLRAEDAGSAAHPAHRGYLDATVPLLRGAGFVPLGRFASSDPRRGLDATVVLLQQRDTSDLAHVLVGTQAGTSEAAQTLVFSRVRSDGSRIATVRQSLPSPFPPPPGDDVLRVGESVDALALWSIHRRRVAADLSAKRNDPVTDAFHFQTSLERDAVRRHIASGLWQPDERPDLLRPTARGAVLMCLRMLAPWKQAVRVRGSLRARRLLRQATRDDAPL